MNEIAWDFIVLKNDGQNISALKVTVWQFSREKRGFKLTRQFLVGNLLFNIKLSCQHSLILRSKGQAESFSPRSGWCEKDKRLLFPDIKFTIPAAFKVR
jgi:hypothetical protein